MAAMRVRDQSAGCYTPTQPQHSALRSAARIAPAAGAVPRTRWWAAIASAIPVAVRVRLPARLPR